MIRQAPLLLLAGLLWIFGSSADADTLNGAVLINWNPNYLYGTPSYVPGLYYWNNDSGDAPNANIGWCLLGGSECGMQDPAGRLPFYATPYLTAPTNMYFTSSGKQLQLTLDLTMTDQKGGSGDIDFFGYYRTNSAGSAIGSPIILFNSIEQLGATATLPSMSAGQNYAFFIENVEADGTAFQTTFTYYMNSAANSTSGVMAADTLQHFSVFQSGGVYYVGAVDGDACAGEYTINNSGCIPSSVFDYNDIVVTVSGTGSPILSTDGHLSPETQDPTPEPFSAGLFGLGIIILAAASGSRFTRKLR